MQCTGVKYNLGFLIEIFLLHTLQKPKFNSSVHFYLFFLSWKRNWLCSYFSKILRTLLKPLLFSLFTFSLLTSFCILFHFWWKYWKGWAFITCPCGGRPTPNLISCQAAHSSRCCSHLKEFSAEILQRKHLPLNETTRLYSVKQKKKQILQKKHLPLNETCRLYWLQQLQRARREFTQNSTNGQKSSGRSTVRRKSTIDYCRKEKAWKKRKYWIDYCLSNWVCSRREVKVMSQRSRVLSRWDHSSYLQSIIRTTHHSPYLQYNHHPAIHLIILLLVFSKSKVILHNQCHPLFTLSW